MKTKLSTLAVLFLFNSVLSQTKEVQITTDKLLQEYKFTDNGLVYFLCGNMHSSMKTTANKIISVYDADLNKQSEITLPSLKDINVRVITSPSGNFLGFNERNTFEYSELDSYDYDSDYFLNNYFDNSKDYKLLAERNSEGPLKDIIKRFYTDDYQIYFGKLKLINSRKKFKGEEFSELYFYRTDIKTLKTKLIKIDFPTESFPNAKMYYQYQSHTNEKVFFILNELVDEGKKNVCNLVSFDYEGKLIDKIPFTMELESKEFLEANALSLYNVENRALSNKNGTMASDKTDGTSVSVKLDPDGKSFYSYGYSCDENPRKGKLSTGYYIYKYDFNGTILWKLEKKINEKEHSSKHADFKGVTDNLVLINDNKIAFWNQRNYTKNTEFYIIDAATGKVLDTKTSEITKNDDLKLSRHKSFTGLKSNLAVDKLSKKVRLDMNTIFAYNFSPEVKKYINSLQEGKFVGYLNKNGIYLILENDKEDNYKLLKFNW